MGKTGKGNKSYITGRYFEYLTRSWLERSGYYVMRSAGSHSIFDLAVFPLYNAEEVGLDEFNPFLIQIKGLNFSILLGDITTLKNYLSRKELELFREIQFGSSLFKKFLFIYNTENKKDLPLVYLYSKTGWLRVDSNPTIFDKIPKISGQMANVLRPPQGEGPA
jgi:hypothetical protein